MKTPEVHLDIPPLAHMYVRFGKGLQSVGMLRTTRSLKFLALLLGCGAVVFAVALALVPWVQTVSGTGKVVAYAPGDRVQTLEAPLEGRIERWHVAEGDKVSKGQLLVEIVDNDPDIMERLQREHAALEAKMRATEQSLATARVNVERQSNLWQQGLAARRSFEIAELEHAKFLSEMSSVAAELARIETRIARQSSQSVVAPSAGIVQRILAPQGGVQVKAGSRLATIVPTSIDRAVELLVSGNDIPLVTVGREVRLQFEGWPAVQFAGWPSVAVGTFAGIVGVVDPSDDGTGKFRIVVFPKAGVEWPDPVYLRQGVRVLGWILLDEVRLGWELWRRFNAFPLSLPEPQSPSPPQ